MKKTVVAASMLCALVLSLLPGSAAHAGPREREDVVAYEAAVLAELMHQYADQGRKYPRKMTNQRAKRVLDHELAKKARIVKYQRSNGGRDYRLCVVHEDGGWATWSTRTRDIRSAGRGAACRF